MSHIDVTPRLSIGKSPAETLSSELLVIEDPSRGTFVRGLAFGLSLGLTFWTFVAVAIFRH